MKASIRAGKRNNIRTDYTLRLLGLEVTPLMQPPRSMARKHDQTLACSERVTGPN